MCLLLAVLGFGFVCVVIVGFWVARFGLGFQLVVLLVVCLWMLFGLGFRFVWCAYRFWIDLTLLLCLFVGCLILQRVVLGLLCGSWVWRFDCFVC